MSILCLFDGGGGAAFRFPNAVRGWWIVGQLRGWPDRTRHQPAPAIGADAVECFVGAIGAKSALETANARVMAIRRQIPVTAFTIGAQFQHGVIPQKEQIVRAAPPAERKRSGQ